MSQLNKEEFFNTLSTIIGDRSDAESIKALEDITDTYNALEKGVKGDGVDWEQKFRDNDKAWREKYRSRFMRGDGCSGPSREPQGASSGYKPEEVDFDDLFKSK